MKSQFHPGQPTRHVIDLQVLSKGPTASYQVASWILLPLAFCQNSSPSLCSVSAGRALPVSRFLCILQSYRTEPPTEGQVDFNMIR